MTSNILNKKILIIGGTGSLGNALIKRYYENNTIYVYSRDECKHWKMSFEYKNKIEFIIGDIINKYKIQQTLIRHNFDIIILAAAMKHIDRCEYESNECIETNLLGTKNVLDVIEINKSLLKNLESVCFISTDKACSPVNIYGMSKAISECLVIEKTKYINDIKMVCVRYGNVLNSRGSIIPVLHEIGNTPNKDYFITDKRMTRFIMTLDQSVDLIEHAIIYAESGDVVIPKLVSCNIIDLIEIFAEKYNKKINMGELRPGEKLYEALINDTQSMRLEKNGDYTYIKPPYKNINNKDLKLMTYDSKINMLEKNKLKEYLIKLNLL